MNLEHEIPPHTFSEVAGTPKLKVTTMTLDQIYSLVVWDEKIDIHIARMARDKGLTMRQRWDRDTKEEIEQRDIEIGWEGREIKRT